MSNTSTLQRDRNRDKDVETYHAQAIIDACEQLIHLAAERCDAEDELFWSKLSEMALKGPDRTELIPQTSVFTAYPIVH